MVRPFSKGRLVTTLLLFLLVWPVLCRNSSFQIDDPSLRKLIDNDAFSYEILRMFRAVDSDDLCRVCQTGLGMMKRVVSYAPEAIPRILHQLCEDESLKENSRCDLTYYDSSSRSSFFEDFVNVLSIMDSSGIDGEYFCHYILQGMCKRPNTPTVDMSSWWPPKPHHVKRPPRSGKTFKVLHISDIHLAVSYAMGEEGNCLGMMCCLADSIHDPLEDRFPAPRYGYYNCDAPPILVESSLEQVVAACEENDFEYEFALFTGDMVDHDPLGITLERSVFEEEQVMKYLKTHLEEIPVFAVLGNHDSYPFSQVAQKSSGFGDLFSFNWELMAHLWSDYDWIDAETADQARLHYGGYATVTKQGLKIIALNSNFWYRWNLYNYWDMYDPDTSGTLRFLVDELLECERSGNRAWVIAHVPPGGIADEALPVASDALAQILERFSPETIAGLFFGHTHQDEFTVLYKGNEFERTAEDAINVAWIGPSVTPFSHYNPSWRYYEVDSGSLEIVNSYTFYALLGDTFQEDTPLEWRYEYSAREDYDPDGIWPRDEPLTAKFWHTIAEKIKSDPEFSQLYADHAFRHSPFVPNCTSHQCMFENYCYTTSMTVDQALTCREENNVKMRKFLTGGPTYPMPRPVREFIDNSYD
jgi:sphingomyelin phosphodiesterase